jgi:hypothetical protein
MKTLAWSTFALLLAAASASAAILGVLVHSEIITTVTGQMAWRCTYNVAGQNTTIILKQMCPPSLQFE